MIGSLLTLAEAAPTLPPWRPFLDPLPSAWMQHWYLWLPVVSFLVALVYKAVRVRHLRELPFQVALMTVQIILGMIGLAIASYLLVEIYVAWIRGS